MTRVIRIFKLNDLKKVVHNREYLLMRDYLKTLLGSKHVKRIYFIDSDEGYFIKAHYLGKRVTTKSLGARLIGWSPLSKKDANPFYPLRLQ